MASSYQTRFFSMNYFLEGNKKNKNIKKINITTLGAGFFIIFAFSYFSKLAAFFQLLQAPDRQIIPYFLQ